MIDKGYIYCPYIPLQMSTVDISMYTVSWQRYLTRLEESYKTWAETGYYDPSTGVDDVNGMMQNRFPGPYTVIEVWDEQTKQFVEFRLEFDDPKKEILWRIDNG